MDVISKQPSLKILGQFRKHRETTQIGSMLLRIQRCKYNQQRLKQQTTEANITRHNTNQITEQTALRTKRSTSSVSKFYDQKAQRQTFDSKRKKGHWYLKIKRWPTQRLI